MLNTGMSITVLGPDGFSCSVLPNSPIDRDDIVDFLVVDILEETQVAALCAHEKEEHLRGAANRNAATAVITVFRE